MTAFSLAQHKAVLLAVHHDRPQNGARVGHAFRAIEEGLAELMSLGHPFHIVEGPPPLEGEIWPRLYFHVKAAPNGRMVNSQWDLADLGEGWFGSLEEAQHADGMETQFAGRGGVGRKDLPMVIDQDPGLAQLYALDAERQKRKMIDDFLKQQRN